MQNGTYRIKHKMLLHEDELVVSRKVFRIKDDAYSEDYILNTFDILEKKKGAGNSFDIVWIVGDVQKERLRLRKSYPVCKTKSDLMRKTTHKSGKLLIIRSDKEIS